MEGDFIDEPGPTGSPPLPWLICRLASPDAIDLEGQPAPRWWGRPGKIGRTGGAAVSCQWVR